MQKMKLLSMIMFTGFILCIPFSEVYPITGSGNSAPIIQKSNHSPDQYHLEFSEVNPEIVKIEAQLTLQDSLLKMSNHGPMPHRWPQYVHDLVAYGKNGKQLELVKRDSTAWKVHDMYKGQEVLIRYYVLIEHEKQNWPGGIDGVAFVRDWGITATGRSLFIINGDKADIKVRFKKPEHWKISTPWKSVNHENTEYVVTNQSHLLESFITVGTQQESNITREDFSLNFVLGGENIAKNKEHYVNAANKIVDYYINLMGGLPKHSSWNEPSQVLIIMNESKTMDGEVIGDNISLFMNPDANPQEQVISWFLFAHEFFHLWNGKTIRFDDTHSDWFKEGVTNYYTLKALYNAKLVDEEAIKMVMNQLFYARYVNDTGLGKMAPSDAASGFDKDNHWGLVYGGGFFAGICMDMEIRHNTENTQSLDDLMRFLYTKTGVTAKLTNNQDILNQVNLLGHTDFTQFFKAYINGLEEIQLNNYLAFAGIEVKTDNKQLQLIHTLRKTDLQQKLWYGFLGLN